MRGFVREFWPFLLVAAILHGALGAFLVISLDRSVPIVDAADMPEAIDATVVDESVVEAELERIRDTERRREQAVIDAQRAVEAAQRQREQEEQRTRELQAQQEREAREAQALRERQQREQAAREQAERERLAEQARQRQAAAERERQAAAERERQAAAERERQAAAERERQASAERERRAAAERDRLLGIYIRDIQGKVARNWIRPDNWPPGVACEVEVSQIPGGEVVNVRVVRTCGSSAWDRSVETAVYRASPLPPPPDPSVFNRRIIFTFRGDS